ncbi:hypothetical protein A0H81_13044 [Grifola frondosa]|uniref:Uncharacterized protein n=1 Tax=Grifola frondosa TaxID=5627 RepID=A0A1C7LRB2_GRIFR|nr:hypothetical protein A0H81_13044 [Grifola frondosa]
MPLEDSPRILDGKGAILAAAKQQRPVEKLKASDCRCLAELSDKWWISSPNMTFVPEVPVHHADQVFRMGADGMYGAFELFKWPQVYDERYPHGMASPGNPDLLRNLQIVSFPIEDEVDVLPVFADPDVAWWHFSNQDFKPALDIPGAQVGHLQPKALQCLREAVREVSKQVQQCVRRHLDPSPDDPPPRVQYLEDRVRFIWRQTKRLQSAVVHLEEIPMSMFDIAQWFREVQRLLLEIRGWLIYIDVLMPRIIAPGFHDERHVLPVRGAFTGRLSVAETLFRCGVPVWWVRPAYTLTTSTVILRVREVIPASVHFNPKFEMKHGKYSQEAPTWLEARMFDDLSESIVGQLRRFSLSSRPTLRKVAAVWEAPAEPNESVAEEGCSANAPCDDELAADFSHSAGFERRTVGETREREATPKAPALSAAAQGEPLFFSGGVAG